MLKISFLCVCFHILMASKLADFKEKMEAKVKGLAEEMKKSFDDRCDAEVASCDIKSFDEC